MRLGNLPVVCRLMAQGAAVVACLAAGACADKQRSIGQSPYEAWSCDQLNREVARTDAAFTRGQKNAVEQAMGARKCIHPLAAETE